VFGGLRGKSLFFLSVANFQHLQTTFFLKPPNSPHTLSDMDIQNLLESFLDLLTFSKDDVSIPKSKSKADFTWPKHMLCPKIAHSKQLAKRRGIRLSVVVPYTARGVQAKKLSSPRNINAGRCRMVRAARANQEVEYVCSRTPLAPTTRQKG
jgi:hypothetical protein